MTPRLKTYARAKRDPAMAIALEMERIEKDLEAKIMAKVSASFNSSVLKEAFADFRGIDGTTPVKGKDYFTNEEIDEIVRIIQGSIRTPEDGMDADEDRIIEAVLSKIQIPQPREPKDGKDGNTPIAGIDYPTEEQIKALISTEISYLFSIKPKEKGITKDEINQMIGKIQQKIDWKENAKEIARALETLKGREKLDYNALKNLPDLDKKESKNGIMRGGGEKTEYYDLSSLTDGVTKVFTIPANKKVLLVLGTDSPAGQYRQTVDYTVSGTRNTTLTLTSAVSAPTAGATLHIIYVP